MSKDKTHDEVHQVKVDCNSFNVKLSCVEIDLAIYIVDAQNKFFCVVL